ncbi:Dihydroorotase [Cryphonectria parasitica EP155]|uniref:dihydroorotase n=1 Tax=Cryphonectria parasitica (strain ATCC 38755 / EP155) TaxID=660469 RepID=A0A9P4XUM8_CRYP1|nr:Dihydroorotase [Cryphonectria parasitica EP155]KAF3761127.1 Dihydroorotase [Cryphonectria parasitica EP155]
MPLPTKYELPAAADFHVHLRDGAMSAAVVPTIRQGGVNVAYVMPNLVPPVTTVAQALAYKDRLHALDPTVTYLMTLYLHPSITPEVVREAKKAGLEGIKSYPQGLTTNSDSGVTDYEAFYPVFAAMEEEGLVLNIHGECASDHAKNITILNAEASFLPTLKEIHSRFPRLRIVLEHCTTADAVRAVEACGETVVGTITAHHLFLIVDDWAGDVFHYCKPVAKMPNDRLALLKALVNSKGKFFLGTDSAPHDITAKKGKGNTAAGVFTQPYAVSYVLTALEEAIARGDIEEGQVTQQLLEGFLGAWGRRFYGVEPSTERIVVEKKDEVVVDSIKGEGLEVVPFRKGKNTWSVRWL